MLDEHERTQGSFEVLERWVVLAYEGVDEVN
jgi:hypothetical protein